jgi:c-di-GMP-binding flagellar brake protein YcgR
MRESMAQDRRRHQRIQIKQMIEISYKKESYLHALTENISKSGMLCRCDAPVEHYSNIFLMMDIGTTEEPQCISCEGVVIRCDEREEYYDVGIEFTHIDNEVLFNEFIDSLESEN